MAQTSRRKRTRQAKNPLLGMAFSLVGVSAALLATAGLFRSHTLLEEAAAAFDTPAMLALGLGTLFLVSHFLTKRKQPDAPLRTSMSGHSHRVDPNNPAQAAPPTTLADSWGPHVFTAIEWRRFEAVCEMLFAQAGFETRAQTHGADGGVDIWLYSKNARGPVAVVQCKHWQGKPVGVKELREFLGVMASHGLKRGTYATTSSYTREARAFAEANGINAMDGPALLALIGTRTPEQQAALLAVAYEGEYWRPTCASCGIKLVERKPVKGHALFWGCTNFPRCKTRIYMVPV